jgi:hypothetical protein
MLFDRTQLVDPDPAHAGFVRWLLASVLLGVAALLFALWWLDPISVTGRQTRFSVVENGGIRQAKLDLMEELASPPDVLVLGSSRSMQLDPADVQQIAGAEAFNGAVSGGTARDMYLYARYAAELWGGEEDAFPHLVLGVVNDSLRPGGTAVLDPRLRRYLPRARQEHPPLEVAEELLQVRTLQAALRATRHVLARDGIGSLLDPTGQPAGVDADLARPGRQKNNRRDLLDARGMSRPGPEAAEGTLAQRIDRQMQEYLASTFAEGDAFNGVHEQGLSLLRRTIELANRHGDVPTLWITPFHPDARTRLPPEYEARDRRFRDALEDMRADPALRFELVDLDDIASFGGVVDGFHDGIHMSTDNTARVLGHLHRLGQLHGAAHAAAGVA